MKLDRLFKRWKSEQGQIFGLFTMYQESCGKRKYLIRPTFIDDYLQKIFFYTKTKEWSFRSL